jgi:hypothetical protein
MQQMEDRIELDEKHWLRTRRNDAQGAVFELWLLLYRNPSGGTGSQQMGHLFTFFESDCVVEDTVPHWNAHLFFLQDSLIPESLAKKIGEVLLSQTACEEPMGFSGYAYIPSVYGSKEDRSFYLEYGEVFTED